MQEEPAKRKRGQQGKISRRPGDVPQECLDWSQEVQLLSLFASQRKAVRDTVLEQCVGESVCVLGLFLSLACFRRLFQLGKMRLARFSRGETVVDLRMKGQPRLARVACQEAKVRAYLVTLYTSTLDAVACRALLVKTNLCTSRKPKL